MEREYSIDNLRAIAILLVVLGHSIIIYDPSWGLIHTSIDCLPFLYLKKVINLLQMPLFFSLSGFCYSLSKNKTFSGKLFVNKVKRIIIPYFIVCLLYMDPIKLLLQVPGYDFSLNLILQQVLLFVNNGHLWYLPTLFLMFIVASLIFWGGKKCVFATLLIAVLVSVFSSHAPSYFSISQFCLYFVYFVLGYTICLYKERLKEKKTLGLIAIVIPCVMVLFFQNGGLIMRSFMLILSIMAVWGCYMVISAKQNSWLMRLSKDSYGIYLFHSPLIYFMYMMYPDANPLVMLFVNFFLCGCISVCLVYIIRKLGLEFIIGEK